MCFFAAARPQADVAILSTAISNPFPEQIKRYYRASRIILYVQIAPHKQLQHMPAGMRTLPTCDAVRRSHHLPAPVPLMPDNIFSFFCSIINCHRVHAFGSATLCKYNSSYALCVDKGGRAAARAPKRGGRRPSMPYNYYYKFCRYNGKSCRIIST